MVEKNIKANNSLIKRAKFKILPAKNIGRKMNPFLIHCFARISLRNRLITSYPSFPNP